MKKTLCLIFALVFCIFAFASCAKPQEVQVQASQTAAPTDSPASSQPQEEAAQPVEEPTLNPIYDIEKPQDSRMINFNEINYVPADYQPYIDKIAAASEAIDKGEFTKEMAFELLDELTIVFEKFQTDRNYLTIMSYKDLTDTTWAQNLQEFGVSATPFAQAYMLLMPRFVNQPYFNELAQAYPYAFSTVVKGLEKSDDTANLTEDIKKTTELLGEASELTSRMTQLISEYNTLWSTLTIPYNNEELNLKQLRNLEKNPESDAAYNLYFDTHYETLANVYIEIVNIRNKLAKMYESENFAELFQTQNSNDYTIEMLTDVVEDVQKYLKPAYDKYSKNITTPKFKVESVDEFNAFLMETLSAMDKNIGNNFAYMNKYELSDIESRATKNPSQFTISLPSYDMAYLMIDYLGTPSSMSTYAHEFGHFNDILKNKISGSEEGMTTDVLEIFSHSMEALMAAKYKKLLGEEDGAAMEDYVIDDLVDNMLVASQYTLFENNVYSTKEELTPELLAEMYMETEKAFGDDDKVGGRSWVNISHFYSSPFYMPGYLTSADVALQLYAISQTDEKKALEIYNTMLENRNTKKFVDLVNSAGIKTVFDEGRVKELSELLISIADTAS